MRIIISSITICQKGGSSQGSDQTRHCQSTRTGRIPQLNLCSSEHYVRGKIFSDNLADSGYS